MNAGFILRLKVRQGEGGEAPVVTICIQRQYGQSLSLSLPTTPVLLLIPYRGQRTTMHICSDDIPSMHRLGSHFPCPDAGGVAHGCGWDVDQPDQLSVNF